MSQDVKIQLGSGSVKDHVLVDADNLIFTNPTEMELLHSTAFIYLNTHRAPDKQQLGFPPNVRHTIANGSLRAMLLGPAAKGRQRVKGTEQNDFRRSAFNLDVNNAAHIVAAASVGTTIKKAVKHWLKDWMKRLFGR